MIPSNLDNPYPPLESDSSLQRDSVVLQSKDLLVQESFPPKYILLLKGALPTPCHKLRVAINEPDIENQINLEVYSVVDPNVICIQILAKLDARIEFNGYPAGNYTVWVNGEKVGNMEIPGASLAMKGYELYSWQSQGNWYFSLLEGTNRLKSIEEIMKPDARLIGIDGLKQALEYLPPGEQVFWIIREIPGLSMPPDSVVDEIRVFCDQFGLQLEVEGIIPE